MLRIRSAVDSSTTSFRGSEPFGNRGALLKTVPLPYYAMERN